MSVYVGNNPVNYLDPNGLWLMEASIAARKGHYDLREYLNRKAVRKAPVGDSNYSVVDAAIYHQQGVGNESNVKYVSRDGHLEGIYDAEGNWVDDPVNRGSYNFAGPSEWAGHFLLDMLPYYFMGNTSDDPSTIWERITATYEKKESNCK